MRIKLLFLTLFISFLTSNIQAKSSLGTKEGLELLDKRLAEVAVINNMEFKKVFADHENKYSVVYERRQWEEALFFDANGLVRKSVHKYSFPEGDGYYKYYYDKEGICIFAISGFFSGHDGDISVQVIRDDEGNWLHIEYIENDGDGLDVVVKHIIRNGSYSQEQLHQLPEMENYTHAYFNSTQELLEKALFKYNINELTLPDEYIDVKFITPKRGDITHVKYNYVPVYKNANESSIIIGHIYISHLFKVIKTSQGWLKIERPGDGDSTYGYKELTGYIKGELAEPVEKIIEINTHSNPTVAKDN